MKNKIVVIVGFGAGLGLGYILGVQKVKKEYKEATLAVKDFYNDKLVEFGVMGRDFTPAAMIDQIIEDDEEIYGAAAGEYFKEVASYSSAATEHSEGPRGKGRPIIKYNKPPLVMKDYGNIPGEEPEEQEEEFEDEDYEEELEARAEEFAKRKHENRTNGLPYVIDFDEYHDGPVDYTKQTLYYYSVDRVLCEDDDTMVDDEEGLVGLDYEDVLDMQTTVWVRNDAILTMYEIQRLDASYDQTVANVVETPREREYRILGRRKEGMDN